MIEAPYIGAAYGEPEPRVFFHCSNCSGEIQTGDSYVDYDGEVFCHSDCIGVYLLRTVQAVKWVAGR